MKAKGMMAVEIMVLVILAVIVLAVLVGVIIFGGQKPTSDLAKQTFVRSCCQLNMPLTCTNIGSVKCVVSKEYASSFVADPDGRIKLIDAAQTIGIYGEPGAKTFCGCG